MIDNNYDSATRMSALVRDNYMSLLEKKREHHILYDVICLVKALEVNEMTDAELHGALILIATIYDVPFPVAQEAFQHVLESKNEQKHHN